MPAKSKKGQKSEPAPRAPTGVSPEVSAFSSGRAIPLGPFFFCEECSRHISYTLRPDWGSFISRAASRTISFSDGVAPGDRVAFLSFNTAQLLEGYYAAPLIRGIAMPLNVRLAPMELAAILNHAEPRVLFYEPDFAPLIQHLRPACPTVQGRAAASFARTSLESPGTWP